MTSIIKQYCYCFIFTLMLRPVTATIFIFAFLIQSFSGQFIRLNYYLNTTTFAKNCENKARPKLHCNGKCQMMKKMQQEEKKDQQGPGRRYENKNEVLSSRSFFCMINKNAVLPHFIYFIKNSGPAIDLAISVFHPPQGRIFPIV